MTEEAGDGCKDVDDQVQQAARRAQGGGGAVRARYLVSETDAPDAASSARLCARRRLPLAELAKVRAGKAKPVANKPAAKKPAAKKPAATKPAATKPAAKKPAAKKPAKP